MKKLICFVAIVLMVMGLAIPAFAAANVTSYGGGSGLSTLKTVTTINTDTGSYDRTNISETTYVIPSKCVVIGYSVNLLQGTTTANEGIVSIVDAVSGTLDQDTAIVSESEATVYQPINVIFPTGLRLTRGLTINQGPSTSVTVYYIQDRP